MHLRARWLIMLGLLGVAGAGWLGWAVGHTEPPPIPLALADVIAVVGLLVGPWLLLAGRALVRQLDGAAGAGRVYSRVLVATAAFAIGGPATALILGGLIFDAPEIAFGLGMFSILAGAVVALIGAVILPWTFVLARTIAKERAARIRAEGRAEVAAHLHDTVLQALTLIQKQTGDPAAVLRLARGTERELRAWLYGAPPAAPDDLAAAVHALVAETEDRYGITVELGVVGTCRLGPPAAAVLGAIGEALTNAAKHAGTPQVSVYVEVTDDEVFAIVRDRGRGFDPAVPPPGHRRGLADSISDRIQQHGGVATVRSAPGAGTEVELRMPLRTPATA